MSLRTRALDPYSEVVDEGRRFTPEWYSFISAIKQIGTFADLPRGQGNVFPGDRAFITDSTTNVFGAITTGGGAFGVPVYFDGNSWKVG
jgi:hypothetical protein